jgi:formylglycine-generating enzyme required for sulfatase activity
MTPQSIAPVQPRPLEIFLCHASGDKPAVRDLYRRLRAEGFDPWLDEEKLLPGQDWQLEIAQAIRSSDAVIVCLSTRAVTKRGYVQKEIRYALDVADEQPEGAIFLIPLRLEDCDVPHRLQRWHWVDLFHDEGYNRLLRALRARAQALGLPTHPFEPEMILIPAGDFLMGSDPVKDKGAYDRERPQHKLYLPDYYIARTPITNAQYAAFVKATYHELPDHWERGRPPGGKEDYPVVNVSWRDAITYCDWLAELTGQPYCLPSEAEWEKAARGTDGRIYPWGDRWNPQRCNSKEAGIEDTTPVGAYPEGASPYGLLDMAGNVRQWTRSLYRDYPYDPKDGRENLDVHARRLLRGSSGYSLRRDVRCAYRGVDLRISLGLTVGFRVVFPSSPAS